MDEKPEPERCCFDDWVDHWTTETTKKPTAAKVTASLLEDRGLNLDDLPEEEIRELFRSARS